MTLPRTSIRPANLQWYDPLPASPALRVGDLLFISGQVSLTADFQPLHRGDVKAQAQAAFAQIREILELAGGAMDDIVEIMSFHHDLRSMDPVFDVARTFFRDNYPAWTPLGMLGTIHPDALVSIRAVAHLGAEKKECFTPDTIKWWRDYPLSGGCKKGNLLFISGQVAADADGYLTTPGNHAGQARFAFNRIKEIVQQAGGALDDVIDVLCFHQDARGMGEAVDVWWREFIAGVPLDRVTAMTQIATPGFYKVGMLGAYRAIADFTPGPRIAKTPKSIWWHTLPVSGGTKKEGGHLIAISGEVASDGDGNITIPGDVAGQARYAFNRIKEVLEMFGASMANVAEIISFHKDPRAWETVMQVGATYFDTDTPPAWTPVGMTGLYQEGYLHEIYATAVV